VVVAEGTAHCRLTRQLGIGRCVDVDRPSAIAEAIAELITLPAPDRDRLRRQIRAKALESYTWEVQQAGLVGLYRSLAA